MNYSYIPQKVTKYYFIYDKTCPHCFNQNAVQVFNMIDCKLFYCDVCRRQFESTRILERRSYISEEIPQHN